MVTLRKTRLTWTLAVATVASTLSLVGCADVTDALEDESQDEPALEQVAGDAGTAAGEASGPKWSQREDPGVGDGKDVIMIGDSWMTMYGGGLQAGINAAPGHKPYRGYGVPGTQLTNGQIPSQFTSASRTNKNIRTVIMTGGGNDVLLNPVATAACRDPSCSTLVSIRNGLEKLWKQMGAAGVKDVVYIGYAEGAGSSPPQVTNVSKNGISKLCDEIAEINCHWLDSTPIVRGRLQDGIHPTGAAHKDLGAAVFKLMIERKVRR